MTKPSNDLVSYLRDHSDVAGIVLDFDGTLSEIVDHPDDAAPLAGVREAVGALAGRYSLVAVVSGRPSKELGERLGVSGIRCEGLYGLDEEAAEVDPTLVDSVRTAAALVEGVWVEEKGASVAVHYRKAADVEAARAQLGVALAEATAGSGYEVVEGKMVLELLPADRPRKGGAVERLAAETKLQAILYAGDDVADIEAFEALERLAAQGIHATKVAVGGPETPDALLDAADVTVDGPGGLLELLRQLA